MVNDNEKVYDEQLMPLLNRVLGICREHEIPFAAEFEIAPNIISTTMYVNSYTGAGDHMQDLAIYIEGKIRKREYVSQGDTRPEPPVN